MPSKKKKYNSRFPPARIKKIMQTDDEIGKVAAAVPVLISKCLEMFLTSILSSAGEVTKEKRAKTMSTSHLKECIMNESIFDFLKDTVADVPDMQNEEEPGTSGAAPSQEHKKLSKRRSAHNANAAKKRVKLTLRDATEESEVADDDDDDEDINVDDDQNGTGTAAPTASNIMQPELKSATDARSSFHISLDALMSNNPASRGGQPVQVTGQEAQESKRKVATHSAATDKKSDAANNGVVSPQKPMDLTVNSSENRETVKQAPPKTRPAVPEPHRPTENPPLVQSGPAGVAHNIPLTPLNMSHLNNPDALPPAPPVNPSLTKDLNTKIPEGGMLSFLYSGLPGEPGVPMPPVPKPAGSDPAYPYNPVAEHYKRMPPRPAAPYVPVLASNAQAMAPPMRVAQPQEDDDYDN